MNIDEHLLNKLSSIHSVPQGAYNIRRNGQLVERKCVEGIAIDNHPDKNGIIVRVSDNVANQSIHIPVIITQSNIHDEVHNDFFIGKNTNITIVAGCGLHADTSANNSHNGIHEFWVGENSTVRYYETHYAEGQPKAQKILTPTTILHLATGAHVIMETTQIGGVSQSKRTTIADLDNFATLEIKESILTTDTETTSTDFLVQLNGCDAKVSVISRSVAKDKSFQEFVSNIEGNNKCFGHVECDAIIFDNARVSSTPALKCNDVNASLSHEAAIGKIASEQLVKLQTLGLTKDEAEQAILKGFLSS